MKKLLILLMLFTLFLSGCGLFNLDGWLVPDDLEFIAVVESLDTPEKIGDYMVENFEYEYHSIYSPDPYTLWQIKKGDCNDISTFGVFIANYHGYKTYQIHVYSKGTTIYHSIAVYTEDNCYSITDNQYYYFGFNNFKEIVNFDSDYMIPNKEWTKYIVYDYWNNVVKQEYNN